MSDPSRPTKTQDDPSDMSTPDLPEAEHPKAPGHSPYAQDEGAAEPSDRDVEADMQTPAIPPPGEYRAKAGGYFRNVRLIFVVVMIGLGLWFLYDGFVKYPEQRAEYRRLDAEVRQIDPITEQERYQQAIAERDQHRDRTDADILLQRLLGILLPVFAIVLLGRWLYISRGEVRLDEKDTLYVPGHEPIPFQSIRWMDDDRWDRKGIAIVNYEKSGNAAEGETRREPGVEYATPRETGTAKLDDFVYERGPIDMIHDRLRHLLDERDGHPAGPASDGDHEPPAPSAAEEPPGQTR